MIKTITLYFPSGANPIMKPWKEMSDVERNREINRFAKRSSGKAATSKSVPTRSPLQQADSEQLLWFSPEMIAFVRDCHEAIRLGRTATANRNAKLSVNST